MKMKERRGAYSGALTAVTPYVLLNQNTLDSLFTLVGHMPCIVISPTRSSPIYMPGTRFLC